MQHTVYLFDRFRLDVTRRKLLSTTGVVMPLNSRAMEALLLLVANAGQIVERRRLMQTIWPHTIVEDNNLNQCILAIRRALGEAAGSNRFVMTVPGRGFCFVCPVHILVQESSDEELSRTGPPSGQSSVRSHRRPIEHRSFWYGLAAGALLGVLTLLPLALY